LFVAAGPAAANTTTATISGNVITMPGGFSGYNGSVGHMVHLCAGANIANCGLPTGPLSEDFATTLGATTMEFWSTDRNSTNQEFGPGPFTIAVRHYDGNGGSFEAGNFTNVVLPERPRQSQSPPPTSGSGSESGPAPFDPATAPPPAAGLALQASVGSRVENSPVSFTGTTMKSGTTYILTVNSDPIVLDQGVIGADGRINGTPRLPALPPGTHTLRLTTTGWDGSKLTLSQVFVVGADGRFTSINDPVGSVTPAKADERLAYTGVSSSNLPWWALSMLSLGILLVLYSARAQQMALRPEHLQALRDARDPWEILSTPIRVPGIDYSPSQAVSSDQVPSLGEAMRELDLAFSKMIVDQLAKIGMAAQKA